MGALVSPTADIKLAVQHQATQKQDGSDLHFDLKPPPGHSKVASPRIANDDQVDFLEFDFGGNRVAAEPLTDYVLYVPVPVLLDGDGPFDVVDSGGERVARLMPRGPSVCQTSRARPSWRRSEGEFQKAFSDGHVLAARPSQKSDKEGSRPINWWRLLLLQPSDNTQVMAQCCVIGAYEFHVRRFDGTFFAKLLHDKDCDCRYTLTVFDGRRYIFLGDRTEQFYWVEDETGVTLATAGRCRSDGGFFTLRVALSTEVGLVLCGILCVEWHVASLYRDSIHL